jgi:hypothetical protein
MIGEGTDVCGECDHRIRVQLIVTGCSETIFCAPANSNGGTVLASATRLDVQLTWEE